MAKHAKTALTEQHHVILTDLYQLYKDDHPATKPYGIPMSDEDHLAIKAQQNIIANSQLTILQFPLYWFNYPGLIQCYWERILEPGFAYPGKFDKSPLCDGRKILFSITTQSTQTDFGSEGKNGSIKDVMFHLATAFRFAGFIILEPFVAYHVAGKSENELKQVLITYQKYLLNIKDNNHIWLYP